MLEWTRRSLSAPNKVCPPCCQGILPACRAPLSYPPWLATWFQKPKVGPDLLELLMVRPHPDSQPPRQLPQHVRRPLHPAMQFMISSAAVPSDLPSLLILFQMDFANPSFQCRGRGEAARAKQRSASSQPALRCATAAATCAAAALTETPAAWTSFPAPSVALRKAGPHLQYAGSQEVPCCKQCNTARHPGVT